MKRNNKKIRVGLLFGGQSGEHDVSLTSAKGVIDAINPDKYEVTLIGITKEGQWLTGDNVHQQLLDASAGDSIIINEGDNSLTYVLDKARHGQLDVIFPIMHGTFGEDGTVQGMLELLDIPYVGCGVISSAAAMDKAIAKDIFRSHGLPIVIHRTFLRRQWQTEPETVVSEVEEGLKYPLFIKPANMGSSVGVHKAANRAELKAGLEDAVRYDRKVVVEQGLDAREVEVAVLGNDEPIASVVGEIVSSQEFYSYSSKYVDDSSNLLVPAPLKPDYIDLIQKLAIISYKALDCSGMARCDFFLERSTGELFINEINTIPGFTPASMYPKLWESSGIPYSRLIDRLIELAFERYQDKKQSLTVYNIL